MFLRVLQLTATLIAIGITLHTFAPQTVDAQAAPQDAAREHAAIRAVLTDQQTAWNRGDVRTFMKGYWNSPELTFASSNGFVRGWEPVAARYERDYPNQAVMGQLDFSDLEIRILGPEAALVLGKWHLHRASGDVGGIFSLVFQKFPEGWRIIHDHTSSIAAPKS
ncbi:MAG: nuclear transport factor 2 family protein [Candidatus Acidiferrum sp.]